MSFKFEKLRIWQLSMDYAEEIHKISENFPKNEVYNLTSQIRRAADSIALNIAEGSILQSLPENRRFLGYSIRSLAEVVTCLYKADRRAYIDKESFKINYEQAYLIMNMMISYRSKIK